MYREDPIGQIRPEPRTVPEMPTHISRCFEVRVLWSTVSKAVVISKRNKIAKCPENDIRSRSLNTFTRAVSVLWHDLKPAWNFSKIPWASRCVWSCSLRTFSKLDSTPGSRLCFLMSVCTTACLKAAGTQARTKEELIGDTIQGSRPFGVSLRKTLRWNTTWRAVGVSSASLFELLFGVEGHHLRLLKKQSEIRPWSRSFFHFLSAYLRAGLRARVVSFNPAVLCRPDSHTHTLTASP